MSAFHLVNFGCRASQADGAALKKQLLEAGLEEASSVERSQVAVLNTCTVTATADAEVRQVIRRIHRLNPGCRIAVTGCYAQRAPQEIAQLEGVSWVIGNSHKHHVADVLKASLGRDEFQIRPRGEVLGPGGLVEIQEVRAATAKDSNLLPGNGHGATRDRSYVTAAAVPASGYPAEVLVGEIADAFHFAPAFPDDRTRPTLKVQDGCNARCSFCIIPAVRGRSRSLAPEILINQVRALDGAGFKEIVLSGINLGSYGKDFHRRITLLGLLERILAETAIPRVRISSIEPMDVSAELVRLVATETRLAKHFHVPLQSGCDRILRLMNRRYWTAQYAERIQEIRAQIPHCGVGADVMVGFPGESAQDHAASARFIESLPFTYLHIFPYSPRPNTAAARSPEQVDPRLVRGRSKDIRSLIAEKRRAFLAAQVGRTLSVLTLDDREKKVCVALSSNYLQVVLPGSDVAPNTLLNARVGRVDGGILFAYAETRGDERRPGLALHSNRELSV